MGEEPPQENDMAGLFHIIHTLLLTGQDCLFEIKLHSFQVTVTHLLARKF